jgi:hypothetical protein
MEADLGLSGTQRGILARAVDATNGGSGVIIQRAAEVTLADLIFVDAANEVQANWDAQVATLAGQGVIVR